MGRRSAEGVEKARLRRRQWDRDNPERKGISNRRYLLKKKYGLSEGDYDKMLEEQGGVCALCSRPEDGGRRLQVDHCHATGVVRKLLCHRCNKALGLFNDSTEVLLRAAAYLSGAHG